MKTGNSFLLVTLLVGSFISCGAPGVPLPPSLHLPQPVTDLRAVRKGNKVHLAWTVPTRTTDRQLIQRESSTQICRSTEAAMSECGIPAEELQPSFVDLSSEKSGRKDLKTTKEYTDILPGTLLKNDGSAQIIYAVAVLNRDRRSAGLSNQVHIPTALTLPPPADLQAKVTADGVELAWTAAMTPPASVELHYFYRIYRREKGKDADTIAGELPLSGLSRFLDHSFDWEKNYGYRITVVADITRLQQPEVQVEGDDSTEIEVFAHDIFPPAVPSGLQAVFSGNETQPFIDLVWSPDMDADLDGYNIYRSEDGGAQVKINIQLLKTPAFRDADVKSGKTYSYSVSAVDVRDNESTRSQTASESVPH